ncbi:MAG: nickel-dependent hydrogenase large subunit, partial [Alphaproteobacteria bacterium]|nr:nickel-dependent hydrogenase large subunit [Alphaproteobacteria bacterium]
MEFATQPIIRAPWPRYKVDVGMWAGLTDDLVAEKITLLGLWGEKTHVHMCVYDPATHDVAIASFAVVNGAFPSVACRHLPATRLERAICDFFGHRAEGAIDTRPWIDHGKWAVRNPLGDGGASDGDTDYAFLPVEGEGVHEIPVGPIHAGIIEPGHFRFSANGETVVRLEGRLGFVHKGVEKLFEGADVACGAKLAGRISGDSTVAYSYAYARAVEEALGVAVPPRAQLLRALMAELERIANHFGDIGAICNDAAFALMLAHLGILREETLRLCCDCFGHRLMMDCVVPGGVAADLFEAGAAQIRDWVRDAEKRFDKLIDVYDSTASLKDRTNNTGAVPNRLVKLFGAGGFVGRASGRAFDARVCLPYEPYDVVKVDMPVMHPGDVNARLWVRRCEVRESFSVIRQIIGRLPEGDIRVPLPAGGGKGEGMAIVEAFRGDVLVWLRLGADGEILRCHPRDASWFQWPLLEAAIENNLVADFPLCNKSF